MMVNLFVRHKVKNYTAWKAAFDAFIKTPRASGAKSYQIFHPDDDPNSLLLFFECDNLANARIFMANPEFKETVGPAGITEAPEAYFLQEYERGVL
jgi:hypothetical protein